MHTPNTSTSPGADKRTLGVAVIGLGVGEQHARGYLRTGVCSLRWVYDLDEARMERIVSELGEGSAARSIDEILDDPQVDIVSIASFDDVHCQQTVASLQSGKHVFVEKPMCRTIEELQAIKQSWVAAGHPKLESNLVLRAAPVYKWLKEQCEQGSMGQLYAIDGDYLYGRIHKITQGWRGKVPDYSVMQGGGIHLADLMLWLAGEKPTTVVSAGNNICTAHTTFDNKDFVTSTFQFESGLVGRITSNYGCVHRHQHVLRVFGTEATFIFDDCGPRLHTSRDPDLRASDVDQATLPASKGDLLPEFVRAILSGADTLERTQREFDLVSVCISADASLKTGKPQEIVYV